MLNFLCKLVVHIIWKLIGWNVCTDYKMLVIKKACQYVLILSYFLHTCITLICEHKQY